MRRTHRSQPDPNEVLRLLSLLSKQAQKSSHENVREILLGAHARLADLLVHQDDEPTMRRAA